MARDCPFLYWDKNAGFMGGLKCRVTDERVETGSALYNSYCHDYESSYSRCPHFRKGNDAPSSSNCFLTSACTEARGLPDDCEELMTLRRFRDEWLKKQPGGLDEIEEYYRIAPEILTAIRQKEDCGKILDELYEMLIVPCARLIEKRQHEAARKLYRETVMKLKEEYMDGRNE